MRIHAKEKKENKNPTVGEKRIHKGFLFLPKWIEREMRWLEQASWEEEYCAIMGNDFNVYGHSTIDVWLPVRWIN